MAVEENLNGLIFTYEKQLHTFTSSDTHLHPAVYIYIYSRASFCIGENGVTEKSQK